MLHKFLAFLRGRTKWPGLIARIFASGLIALLVYLIVQEYLFTLAILWGIAAWAFARNS